MKNKLQKRIIIAIITILLLLLILAEVNILNNNAVIPVLLWICDTAIVTLLLPTE